MSEDTPALGPIIEQIRAQTKLLISIIESMGDGLIVADENGKFLVFNRVAERVLGLGPVQGSLDEWSDRYGVFHPDRVTPFPSSQLPLARAIRGEASDQVELFIKNPNVPDGVFISVTGRPLYDDTGATRGGVIVLRDISERKR